jgi:hypothetical protein
MSRALTSDENKNTRNRMITAVPVDNSGTG